MSAPLGMVDDKGRAFEQTIDAPVDANLEPLAAEPSIPIINDRVRLLGGGGGGGDSRAGGEPPSACQAERWQRLIGMSKADVAEESLPAASRVVDWGAVVTQDYRPERLNVQLDQGGRVYRVVCG